MKENKIIVHKNILNINNLIREFPTKILEIIEFKNFIIIRIGYNSQISDNIFCINYENKIIWNISEIIKKDNEAYTGINKISENIIEVFLFIGVCYRIDVVERKVLKKEIPLDIVERIYQGEPISLEMIHELNDELEDEDIEIIKNELEEIKYPNTL